MEDHAALWPWPLTVEPRPYQAQALSRMVERGNQLLALTMGAGKTIAALAAVELLADAGEVTSGFVFCPNSIKFQWFNEIRRRTNAPCQVIDGDRVQRRYQYKHAHRFRYNVANYDTLRNDHDMLHHFYGQPDFVVADECFVAGTLVDTPDGPRPIELVRPGDAVLSACGAVRVRAVRRTQKSIIVQITTKDGRVLRCSPEHPLLLSTGWTPAIMTRCGDDLIEQREAVRVVQQGAFTREESILRSLLLSEVEDAATRGASQAVQPRSEGQDRQGDQEAHGVTGSQSQGWRVVELVAVRSRASGEGRRQDSSQAAGQAVVGDSGWERHGADAPGGTSSHVADRRVGVATVDTDWRTTRLPDLLQGGHRSSGTEDCGGDRWVIASWEADTGREEGRSASGTRVARVEVLEHGCSAWRWGNQRSVDCYDLEVEAHPSFSVNGLLVHNCTQIKSFRAKRSRVLKSWTKECPYRFALTGQPIENRPEELFSIMEFVDRTVLGPFPRFDRTFILRDHFGRPQRYRNLDVLKDAMEPVMFRRSRKDVEAYLPRINSLEIPVQLSLQVMDLYDYIRNDTLDVIDAVVAAGGMGGWNVLAAYGRAEDERGGKGKGEIMARLTCMRLLCDHPALLVMSADDFDDADTSSGSKYASWLKANGHLAGVHDNTKLETAVELISEILDEDPANRVVLFAYFKPLLRMLARALAKVGVNTAMLTGDMNARHREHSLSRFRRECRVLLSSDAGQYGIDLPQANFLISYDLPWSAGAYAQRVARIDRTSSEWGQVTVISLLTQGTIEERQMEMLRQKRMVAEAWVDGQHIDAKQGLTLTLDSLRSFLGSTVTTEA